MTDASTSQDEPTTRVLYWIVRDGERPLVGRTVKFHAQTGPVGPVLTVYGRTHYGDPFMDAWYAQMPLFVGAENEVGPSPIQVSFENGGVLFLKTSDGRAVKAYAPGEWSSLDYNHDFVEDDFIDPPETNSN